MSELLPLVPPHSSSSSSSSGNSSGNSNDHNDGNQLKKKSNERYASLDQFRGMTMFFMLLVNYLGDVGYDADKVPVWLIHGDSGYHYGGTNIADFVFPWFVFAAGFSFRLVFLKNVKRMGWRTAVKQLFCRRVFGLLVVNLLLHGLGIQFATWHDLKTIGIDKFMHIWLTSSFFAEITQLALTMATTVFVIDQAPWIQLLYSFVAGFIVFPAVYIPVAIHWEPSIANYAGGPFGFLFWSITMVFGSFMHDLVSEKAQPSDRSIAIISTTNIRQDQDDLNESASSAAITSNDIGGDLKTTAKYLYQWFMGRNNEDCIGPCWVSDNIRIGFLFSLSFIMFIFAYLLQYLGTTSLNFDYCVDTSTGQRVSCSKVATPWWPLRIPTDKTTITNLWAFNNQYYASNQVLYSSSGIFIYMIFFVMYDSSYFDRQYFQPLRLRFGLPVGKPRGIPINFVFEVWGMNSIITYMFSQMLKRNWGESVPTNSPIAYIWLIGVLPFMSLMFIIVYSLHEKKQWLSV